MCVRVWEGERLHVFVLTAQESRKDISSLGILLWFLRFTLFKVLRMDISLDLIREKIMFRLFFDVDPDVIDGHGT